jgi:hypothetical protein
LNEGTERVWARLQQRFPLKTLSTTSYLLALAACLLMIVAGSSAEYFLRYETASMLGSWGVWLCLIIATFGIGLYGGRGAWLVLPLLLSFIGPAAILAFLFRACLGDSHACP